MDKNMKKSPQDLGVTLKVNRYCSKFDSRRGDNPFIARYHKDMTGSLDEVAIKAIIDLDKSLTISMTARKLF